MTPEEIKEYDAARGAANLYHTSAVFLQDLSPIIQRLAGKIPVNLNANLITAHVIYALSAEIGLKALLMKEGKTVPRQHDLKSLFLSLDQPLQEEIIQASVAPGEDFSTLLEANKRSFIEWRYFYEGGPKTADISFLRNLSHAIASKATTLNPT